MIARKIGFDSCVMGRAVPAGPHLRVFARPHAAMNPSATRLSSYAAGVGLHARLQCPIVATAYRVRL